MTNGLYSLFDIFEDAFFGVPLSENSSFYSAQTESYLGDDGKYHTHKIINDNGKISKSTDTSVARIPNNRINSALCSGDNYPPTDLYVDEDGSFGIEMLISKCNPKYLGIDYEDEYLTITYKPEQEEAPKGRKYGQRGIKLKPFSKKIFINIKLFDPSNVIYSIENGVLLIKVAKNPNWAPSRTIKPVEKLTETAETSE